LHKNCEKHASCRNVIKALKIFDKKFQKMIKVGLYYRKVVFKMF